MHKLNVTSHPESRSAPAMSTEKMEPSDMITCAQFLLIAPSNVCEFPIIGDRGISADIC